jgi:hypothetical protein
MGPRLGEGVGEEGPAQTLMALVPSDRQLLDEPDVIGRD